MRSIRSFIALIVALTMEPTFAKDCPVTAPGNADVGNDAIGVVLPLDRRFVFLPDGPGFIDEDGGLGISVAWFRKIDGQIEITGRRVDAQAPRARAYLPQGFDRSGVQDSYVVFPTSGCWELTAQLGTSQLTIVVEVEFVAPGPSARMQGVPSGWRRTGG